LPPEDSIGFDRCLTLLQRLAALHAEELNPFRICHVSTDSLFESLGGCSAADVPDLTHLAEYLQLPKALVVRVEQHAAAAELMAPAAGVSARRDSEQCLRDALCGSPVLKPLWAAATSAARASLPAEWSDTSFAVLQHGLCGAPPEAVEGVTGSERTAGAVAQYAAGRMIAGHPPLDSRTIPVTARNQAGPLWVAACAGDLPALQRLHVRESWALTERVVEAAAAGGSVEMMLWLAARGMKPTHRACAAAAGAGRLAMLQWLHARGCPITFGCSTAAAKYGRLEALQWLYGQGVQLTPYVVDAAIHGGQVDVLSWLESKMGALVPPRWPLTVCAAKVGQLPVLQWAHGRGYPLSADVFSEAARRRDGAAMLQWLRAAACPWSEEVCLAAAGSGNLEALQWLRAQEPPCPWDGRLLQLARARRLDDVAEWAAASGCPAMVSSRVPCSVVQL
jgi:hypothetical protein